MSLSNTLIIFAKNEVPGKVKTRLAATIGPDRALNIYKKLLIYTHSISKDIGCRKLVYYSDYIEANDTWMGNYHKALQQGNDLGERMMNALKDVFEKATRKAVIMGTDCPELTTTIIDEAFEKLEEFDVVIGPAADGGYYMLGMKRLHEGLFKNIQWSTETVCAATIELCNRHHLKYHCLAVLIDVDEEKDLQYLNLKSDV